MNNSIQILSFENSIFKTKTYVIYKALLNESWVVDPGSDVEKIFEWHALTKSQPKGVFVTHSHFDHILGLNDLCSHYPLNSIYASPKAVFGFQSAKVNGSYYTDYSFTIQNRDYIELRDGDCVEILGNEKVVIHETPGHSSDSLTFEFKDYVFTGDALIPGIKVITKFKDSSKIEAINSINKIISNVDSWKEIMPGHGEGCKLKDLDTKLLF